MGGGGRARDRGGSEVLQIFTQDLQDESFTH